MKAGAAKARGREIWVPSLDTVGLAGKMPRGGDAHLKREKLFIRMWPP